MGYTNEATEPQPTRTEIDAMAGPLLLEFGAPWCGYCQAVQPSLEALLGRFPEVRHIKIHDGRGKPLGRSFRVKLWPSLIFMRAGQVLLQVARPGAAEILQGLQALREGATNQGDAKQ